MAVNPNGYLTIAFPNWSRFDSALRNKEFEFEDLNFKCTYAEFLRFARRFRVAVAHESTLFERMSETTSSGYHALIRHFLVYSSLELYYTEALGVERNKFHELRLRTSLPELEALQKKLMKIDSQGAICSFMENEFDKDPDIPKLNIRVIKNYFAGHGPENWISLSRALRNSFVHGDLSASPGLAKAGELPRIAQALTDHIIKAIRADFNARLVPYIDDLIELNY